MLMSEVWVDVDPALGLDFAPNFNAKEIPAVTVCVAALSDNRQNVVGASDRMLTTGDQSVQFEPISSKIIQITRSIVIQWAGDSALQAEIVVHVRQDVEQRIHQEPENWWKVEDVASLYQSHYQRIKARRAANTYLSPLNLDTESFVTRNNELQPSLATQLATELIGFKCSRIDAIIAGVDQTGGHIFVVDNYGLYCMDSTGFAAIGAGASHSLSQFMFSRYAPSAEMPEALFLAYTAKRRGEAASGVGSQTDVYGILGLGGYTDVGKHIHDKLSESYKDLVKQEKEAYKNARKGYDEFIEKVIAKAASKAEPEQAASKNDNGDAPADKKEAGGDPDAPNTDAARGGSA